MPHYSPLHLHNYTRVRKLVFVDIPISLIIPRSSFFTAVSIPRGYCEFFTFRPAYVYIFVIGFLCKVDISLVQVQRRVRGSSSFSLRLINLFLGTPLLIFFTLLLRFYMQRRNFVSNTYACAQKSLIHGAFAS